MPNLVPGSVKGAMHEKMAKPETKSPPSRGLEQRRRNTAAYGGGCKHAQGKAKRGALPLESSAGVTLNGRYLPPPEDGDGKRWIRTRPSSMLAQTSFMRFGAMSRRLRSGKNRFPAYARPVQNFSLGDEVQRRHDRVATSEILADETGKRITWRSISGDSHNAGEVIFEHAPGGQERWSSCCRNFGWGNGPTSGKHRGPKSQASCD